MESIIEYWQEIAVGIGAMLAMADKLLLVVFQTIRNIKDNYNSILGKDSKKAGGYFG